MAPWPSQNSLQTLYSGKEVTIYFTCNDIVSLHSRHYAPRKWNSQSYEKKSCYRHIILYICPLITPKKVLVNLGWKYCNKCVMCCCREHWPKGAWKMAGLFERGATSRRNPACRNPLNPWFLSPFASSSKCWLTLRRSFSSISRSLTLPGNEGARCNTRPPSEMITQMLFVGFFFFSE